MFFVTGSFSPILDCVVPRPSGSLGESTVAVVRPIQNSQGDRERMVAVAERRGPCDYLGIRGWASYTVQSVTILVTNSTSSII